MLFLKVEKLFDLGKGEEKGVASQKLGVSEHREAALHFADQGRVTALVQGLKSLGGSHIRDFTLQLGTRSVGP